MYFLNHVKHKTINVFRFNESKHSAIRLTCFLNQTNKCKRNAWFVLNYVKQTTASVL